MLTWPSHLPSALQSNARMTPVRTTAATRAEAEGVEEEGAVGTTITAAGPRATKMTTARRAIMTVAGTAVAAAAEAAIMTVVGTVAEVEGAEGTTTDEAGTMTDGIERAVLPFHTLLHAHRQCLDMWICLKGQK